MWFVMMLNLFPNTTQVYRNNEMLKTAYKSLEASPLTQRVFTKPPTVMFRKVPNLKNFLVKPKFYENQITIINLVQPKCSDKRCAHAKFFRILKSSLVVLLN